MSFTLTIGDCISGIALLLSGYAVYRTVKFNERQKSLIESQEKLNNLLLDKEKSEMANDKKANLGVAFINLGSSKHRLKIWNQGKSMARNIMIEFPEGNDILSQQEINEKFPLESLDTYQSVELFVAVTNMTKRKLPIRLIWADDFNECNRKIVYPTI
jgi:hypothetical protein